MGKNIFLLIFNLSPHLQSQRLITFRFSSMIKKGFYSISALSLLSWAYLKSQKTTLKNPLIVKTLSWLSSYNPAWGINLFKFLVRQQVFKKCDQLSSYRIAYGFDEDGESLKGLFEMGLGGVEIGPLSFLPTTAEEPGRRRFGVKMAKASLYTFFTELWSADNLVLPEEGKVDSHQSSQSWQCNPPRYSPMQVGICIEPNFQVMKYTPYLIEENILNCFRQLQELQDIFSVGQNDSQTYSGAASPANSVCGRKPIISYFIFRLRHSLIEKENSEEYLSMLKAVIGRSEECLRKRFLGLTKLKGSSSDGECHALPRVYIEIPSQQINPGLYRGIRSDKVMISKLLEDQKPANTQTSNSKREDTEGSSKKLKRISETQFFKMVLNDKPIVC